MIDRSEFADERPLPRRRTVWPLAAVLMAFLIGIGIAVLAIRRVDQVGEFVRPSTIVTRNVPVPTPAAPVIVQPAPAGGDPALVARVAAIESRLGEVDSRAQEASGDAERAEGLLVAFAARRALDRGQPMGFLEPLLRRHFGATEPRAVAMVIGSGQRPVTLAQLQQRFVEIEPTLGIARGAEGWWAATRREIGQLFVIRKTQEASALPLDRLSRAERALASGHVDIALDEVARLPGAAGAGGWMLDARRYVVARAALDRIETAALLAPVQAEAQPPLPAS